MFAAVLLLATAQPSSSLDAYDRITPQAAAERVTRCGAGAITVRSDVELGIDVLVVAGTNSLSDQQLACIDKAASFYDVALSPAEQPRLNAIREARSANLVRGEARKWLAAHKLLDRLPRYEPGVTDDTVFARRIERLCHARQALTSRYGVHVLNPEWAMRQSIGDSLEKDPMACVLNALWATGFEINIIGNELAAP